MSEIPLGVLRYCAKEVERQEDGPVAVYHMAVAWDYARSLDVKTLFSVNAYTDSLAREILKIAHLVTPEINVWHGDENFRYTTVTVGDDVPTSWHEIPEAYLRLMKAAPHSPNFGAANGGHLYDSLTQEWHPYEYFVDQWLKALLDIHPWQDGNGRTASIVRNLLCGTLMEPIALPYYYGQR